MINRIVVAVAVATLGLATGVHAQGEGGDCGELLLGCLGGPDSYHNMIQDYPRSNKEGGHGFHGTCNTCEVAGSGGYLVHAINCHPSCIENEDEEVQEAFADLLSAIEGDDISEILSRAAAVPQHVFANVERGALQVIGCEGAIIASVPMPATTLGQLAPSPSL